MPLLIDTPKAFAHRKLQRGAGANGILQELLGIVNQRQATSCTWAPNRQIGAPMAVRRIRLLGDPILRVRCERVLNPKSAATRLVADDLRDTLRAAKEKYKMGRALAAPQIGAPGRIVVVAGRQPRRAAV